MKLFLALAGILAWLFGAMLLIIPRQFYLPTGISLTPMSSTVAQAHGATLIGLGLINWLSRNADRRGLIAVLAGNLLVQVASLAIVVRTMALGAGRAVAPGVAIHLVLGTLFAWFLIRVSWSRDETLSSINRGEP